MKVLILLAALVALAAAAPYQKKPYRDMTKVRDRAALFPGVVPKSKVMPRRNAVAPRIVGGQEADPHSWQHQVAVYINGNSFCGGSIIDESWVLTAAHCCAGVSFIDVVAGAHDLSVNEPSQVRITVPGANVYQHEDYGQFYLTNDVCLLNLPTPLIFNDFISAVQLSTEDPPPDTIVTSTGWGKTADGPGSVNDVLKEANVPVISNEECAALYGPITVNDKSICTGVVEGAGTCNGDSGGPLNHEGTTIGVTSFVSSAGCESGNPDGFARVSGFLDWIEATSGVIPDKKKAHHKCPRC
jgi:secreted trypsin-like serine protease